LQDYWKVYEVHREEITAQLQAMASQHAEFKFILQNTAAQPTAEEQARNRELQRNAVLHGEWEPYLKNLQRQGMGYAQAGLSFHAWFELIAAFRQYMMPHLVNTYGASTELLLSAIHGMDTLLDIAMSNIGDAYLETKEQLIRQQEETVRDALKQQQSERRFRGLLEAAPDGMVTGMLKFWSRNDLEILTPSTANNTERTHVCALWAPTLSFMLFARMKLNFRWRSVSALWRRTMTI
jgi:hypothetical protein